MKYYTTYTYEIYLKDTDGTYKPIPILMKDYPGGNNIIILNKMLIRELKIIINLRGDFL